jgi:hypothetical protein
VPSLAERASGELKGSALVDSFLAGRTAEYRSELIEALRLPRTVCTLVAIRRELVNDGASERINADTIRNWWTRQPEHLETK